MDIFSSKWRRNFGRNTGHSSACCSFLNTLCFSQVSNFLKQKAHFPSLWWGPAFFRCLPRSVPLANVLPHAEQAWFRSDPEFPIRHILCLSLWWDLSCKHVSNLGEKTQWIPLDTTWRNIKSTFTLHNRDVRYPYFDISIDFNIQAASISTSRPISILEMSHYDFETDINIWKLPLRTRYRSRY